MSNGDKINKKPTLYQLRLQHSVNIRALAQESKVSTLTVWHMLTGEKVTKEEATKIINGFNRLKGTHYTLEDIDAAYLPS